MKAMNKNAKTGAAAERKLREPLFHIVKRDALPWYRAWMIRGLAIVAALIFSAIVTMLLTHENPITVYTTMIRGSFATPTRIWNMLQSLAMLLCVSLAVTPAFKMRFWNIGAEGQVLAGGLATAACMIMLGGKMPNWLLYIVMIAASIIAGAVWAVIPAVCKAQWNTNETLFTLMMNYVAIQIVSYFVMVWEVPKGSGKVGIINQATHAGWFPTIGKYDYLLNILIVLALTVLIYFYLKYSKHGYEIAVVGESENTARYIGINSKKVIIRTLVLCGIIAGITGFLLVSATNLDLNSKYTVNGRGFTGVLISWLAKFNPFAMVLTSFLVVFVQKGAAEVSTYARLGASFPSMLAGVFFFFIIASEFFINYKIMFNKKYFKIPACFKKKKQAEVVAEEDK